MRPKRAGGRRPDSWQPSSAREGNRAVATSRHVVATGKRRSLGGGQRPWHASLHTPSGRYSSYRVRFKEDVGGRWVWAVRAAATEDEAWRIFTQVERALDSRTAVPAAAKLNRKRTGKALGELYLGESRSRGKAARTIEQRECRLRVHIGPVLDDLPVTQWRVAHSRQVIAGAQARGVKSVGRLGDIRQDLAAMRALAWREGWLTRDVDPLDGLSLPRQQQLHGAGRGYVPPELRPETRQVEAMAGAADQLVRSGPQELRRLPLLGTQIRLAGYGGLRLGEQFALRAIDVFFDRGLVSVSGSWTQPRERDCPPFRGPVKNGLVHEAPIPRTVLDQLLPRCAELLGLPATASEDDVVQRQRSERIRRGRLVGSPDRWWELPFDPADELWVFVDAVTGLPSRSELFNDRWHRVRRWLKTYDPDNAWPEFIPYRNLRHHAASFWHDQLQREWADVAAWLGDQLTTVITHYVRSGSDALTEVASQLATF